MGVGSLWLEKCKTVDLKKCDSNILQILLFMTQMDVQL
jgi:hypothetical protein